MKAGMRTNLPRASQWAHAVTVATLISFGSNVRAAEAPAYCAELKQVAALALAKEKFASIIRAAREGNFLEANITLPGWRDCSFYGKRTYTCDSQGFKTAGEGELAHTRVVDEVRACLPDGWSEVPGLFSPGYAVLHDERQMASITISKDRTEKGEHLVRIVLFLRSR
jgi:hypothetical protein